MKARRIEQPRPPSIWQRVTEAFLTKGRYRRDAFWAFFVLFGIPATLLQHTITVRLAEWIMLPTGEPFPWTQVGATAALLLLLSWLQLAATIKRLHDRNKSGAWALAGAFPVIGLAYLLFECGLLPSVEADNAFGRTAKDLRSLIA